MSMSIIKNYMGGNVGVLSNYRIVWYENKKLQGELFDCSYKNRLSFVLLVSSVLQIFLADIIVLSKWLRLRSQLLISCKKDNTRLWIFGQGIKWGGGYYKRYPSCPLL
eukprot:TRINITY_DN7908_c0_g1_i2.p4 TRINITY_DN7908_c0_g1~~TRINITY_DN7908_c0_g1_i2.p4  ORF type:complete len:108 (+),score=1.36 TRINITY_DN7908_c0_g1_i2:581-904(+)